MCGESHGELVRQWLYSHIAMLAEHQDISGSFMFLLYNQSSVFIRIIRVRKKNIRVNPCHPWEKKKPPRAHTKRFLSVSGVGLTKQHRYFLYNKEKTRGACPLSSLFYHY